MCFDWTASIVCLFWWSNIYLFLAKKYHLMFRLFVLIERHPLFACFASQMSVCWERKLLPSCCCSSSDDTHSKMGWNHIHGDGLMMIIKIFWGRMNSNLGWKKCKYSSQEILCSYELVKNEKWYKKSIITVLMLKHSHHLPNKRLGWKWIFNLNSKLLIMKKFEHNFWC